MLVSVENLFFSGKPKSSYRTPFLEGVISPTCTMKVKVKSKSEGFHIKGMFKLICLHARNFMSQVPNIATGSIKLLIPPRCTLKLV